MKNIHFLFHCSVVVSLFLSACTNRVVDSDVDLLDEQEFVFYVDEEPKDEGELKAPYRMYDEGFNYCYNEVGNCFPYDITVLYKKETEETVVSFESVQDVIFALDRGEDVRAVIDLHFDALLYWFDALHLDLIARGEYSMVLKVQPGSDVKMVIVSDKSDVIVAVMPFLFESVDKKLAFMKEGFGYTEVPCAEEVVIVLDKLGYSPAFAALYGLTKVSSDLEQTRKYIQTHYQLLQQFIAIEDLKGMIDNGLAMRLYKSGTRCYLIFEEDGKISGVYPLAFM